MIEVLSVVENGILYFFARVVPVKPVADDIIFSFADVFFKHGRIIADVKLPAPMIPTFPLLGAN